MKSDWSGGTSEGWWIDLMEGEVEPERRPGLRLLLEHSKTDRQIYNNFLKLRDLVKSSEPDWNQQKEDYFDVLHAKIMHTIDSQPPLKKPTATQEEIEDSTKWWW